MQNYEFLDKLQAGREFADYLIANGWGIPLFQLDCQSTELGEYETITFCKTLNPGGYSVLTWTSSYRNGTTFEHAVKGFHKGTVHGVIDIEGDLAKFAFLCDIMGWVRLKEANQNCKADTGNSLFQNIANAIKPTKEIEAKAFEPVKESNHLHGLVGSALNLAQ